MNVQYKEAAMRETNSAINADEQANAQYYQVLRRFLTGEAAGPEARLDSAGLKEIDSAWTKVSGTNNNLRRAYMKLYRAYL
jgi:hypothetical protein